MLYDIIIIGGGPAGVAAGVYSARKRMKTLLLTESFGGQSIVSDDIQNWIGEPHISGFELAEKMEAHIRSFSDVVDIKISELVTGVKKIDCDDPRSARTGGRPCNFEVTTEGGKIYEGKALILASGARRKKLGVSGEEEFNGKGVVFCSTCDAPLFGGKDVVVVGGGNAGVEAVIDLLPYANHIYLLHRSETLKADPATVEEMKKNSKVELILNAETVKIEGDKFVTSLTYKNKKTGEEKTLPVGGVFVEIGSTPNSEIVKGIVDIDSWGQVIMDSKHASTSHPGIFAAGDVTDDPYKQNNISAGDAVKAALAAYAYVLQLKKHTPASEEVMG